MEIHSPDWQTGLARLLCTPADLARSGATIWPPERHESVLHRQAFARYLGEVQAALTEAVAWWQDLILVHIERGATPEDARLAAWNARPAGAAAHPRVVDVVRKYFLLCDELNRQVQSGYQVPPERFLLLWLHRAGAEDAVKVLAGMPYWPLGMDPIGQWG